MAKLTNTAKPCSESKIPKRKEKVGEEEKKNIYIYDKKAFSSWTSHISSRTSIVKVSPPNIVSSLSYVIAIGMISQLVHVWERKQVIVPINHLKVSKISCFSKTFFSKMATAHLGASVVTPWTGIHNFSSKLNHACMASQVTEQECWPIPN